MCLHLKIFQSSLELVMDLVKIYKWSLRLMLTSKKDKVWHKMEMKPEIHFNLQINSQLTQCMHLMKALQSEKYKLFNLMAAIVSTRSSNKLNNKMRVSQIVPHIWKMHKEMGTEMKLNTMDLRHMVNIISPVEPYIKDNSIHRAVSVAMEFCTIQAARYVILAVGLIILSMDSVFWTMKILQITYRPQTTKISIWMTLILGIITKGSSAWIKKMDSALCLCVTAISSVDASYVILLKDMVHLRAIREKECLEYGVRIFLENYEMLQ